MAAASKETTYGYVCFYRGKRFEVYAGSSYEAQTRCACENKIKKRSEITVVLAEKNGEPVPYAVTM